MKIAYTKAAQKALRRMPRNDARRILAAIEAYADAPKGQGHNVIKLQARAGYRMRVGDWRVIFDLDGSVLAILAIGPRGQIYDR